MWGCPRVSVARRSSSLVLNRSVSFEWEQRLVPSAREGGQLFGESEAVAVRGGRGMRAGAEYAAVGALYETNGTSGDAAAGWAVTSASGNGTDVTANGGVYVFGGRPLVQRQNHTRMERVDERGRGAGGRVVVELSSASGGPVVSGTRSCRERECRGGAGGRVKREASPGQPSERGPSVGMAPRWTTRCCSASQRGWPLSKPSDACGRSCAASSTVIGMSGCRTGAAASEPRASAARAAVGTCSRVCACCRLLVTP